MEYDNKNRVKKSKQTIINKSRDSISYSEFMYDKHNYQTIEIEKSKKKKKVNTQINTYIGDNLVELVFTDFHNKTTNKLFIYDNNNKLIKSIIDDKSTNIFIYNNKNQIIKIVDENNITNTTITYNKKGQLINISYISDIGKGSMSIEYEDKSCIFYERNYSPYVKILNKSMCKK
jgi:lipopolysaccharide export LptBFGC system permease protein LptF